jgi:tRNA threonylcarbamoyladenosine biosynthesis protein TsaB
VILGLDTSTAATAVAVWAPDGPEVERRDDPAPGTRPGHASRLLPLVDEALAAAQATWDDVERIACGVGPGGFTGLRLGIATARALAQARDLPLIGVSSLSALHEGVRPLHMDALRKSQSDPLEGSDPSALEGSDPSALEGSDPSARSGVVAAVIDARRGEVFAAIWDGDAQVLEPVAIAPGALAAQLPAGALAVGDGAVRFRSELERAGASVPADDSPAHRVSALVVCRLGAAGTPADRDALLPDYRREPDAKPPRLSPP